MYLQTLRFGPTGREQQALGFVTSLAINLAVQNTSSLVRHDRPEQPARLSTACGTNMDHTDLYDVSLMRNLIEIETAMYQPAMEGLQNFKTLPYTELLKEQKKPYKGKEDINHIEPENEESTTLFENIPIKISTLLRMSTISVSTSVPLRQAVCLIG